jgi:hypothetical protein
MIGRRAVITLLGGAATWPVAAPAQQTAIPVVGVLHGASEEAMPLAAFLQGLSQTGYALPTCFSLRTDAAAGALMTYGASNTDSVRQVGNYVGRILRGGAQRSAGTAANQVRVRHQYDNRQGARP